MVSKSTKRKHRINKERIVMREKITILSIDKRCDFWLISSPTIKSGMYLHHECRGKTKALKLHRKLISFI